MNNFSHLPEKSNQRLSSLLSLISYNSETNALGILTVLFRGIDISTYQSTLLLIGCCETSPYSSNYINEFNKKTTKVVLQTLYNTCNNYMARPLNK